MNDIKIISFLLIVLLALASCSKINVNVTQAAFLSPAPTITPAITNVSLPADDSYYEGETLSFGFHFTHAVTVTGTPVLDLVIGGTPVTATYVSGSGSSTLLFQYVVQNTVFGAAPALTSPLTLSGGSIKTASGEDVPLAYTSPDTSGVVIDGRTITMSFAEPLSIVPEDNGTLKSLTLNLSAPLVAPATIPLSFLGNATYGVDFDFAQTSVVVPAGQTSYQIDFDVHNDTDPETSESFITALNRPAGKTNLILGDTVASRVNIIDSDPSKDRWAMISTRHSHTCGITTTGVLKCWGDNSYGQLGDGSGLPQPLPVVVDPGVAYKFVSVSGGHTCGITTLNKLKCWGNNADGQLGNGNKINQPTPVPITSGVDYKHVTAGSSHSCAITLAGAARCWGSNGSGRLGDGTTTDRLTPTAVSGGGTWIDMIANSMYTCGVTTGNVLKCWGYDVSGELGQGSPGFWETTPQTIDSGTSYKAVTGGSIGSCALTTGNTVKCWGYNYGRLGNGTTTPTVVYSPTAVNPGTQYKSISETSDHICGITDSDVLHCWGYNRSGQIGDGTATNALSPKVIDSGTNYLAVSAGNATTCGVTATNMLKCWGNRNSGQGGDGISNKPAPIQSLDTFSSLATGSKHTCAINSTGKVSCWGENASGQLGDGSLVFRDLPRPVKDSAANYVQISSGRTKTCGITSTGTLKCWGDTVQQPTVFDPGTAYKKVFAAYDHHCGITISDSLKCWGKNTYGQLGDGTLVDSSSSTTISHGRIYKTLALGEAHTCGISDSDQLYCWGRNDSGQLGNGTNTDSPTPLLIDSGVTYKKITAGVSHTCGITTTDVLKCWGKNNLNQVGDGSLANRNSPLVVDAGTSYKDIASAENRNCRLSTTNQLTCWGGVFLVSIHYLYDSGVAYSAISAGTNHYCGLVTTTSKIKCWGDVEYTATSYGAFLPMPVGSF